MTSFMKAENMPLRESAEPRSEPAAQEQDEDGHNGEGEMRRVDLGADVPELMMRLINRPSTAVAARAGVFRHDR